MTLLPNSGPVGKVPTDLEGWMTRQTRRRFSPEYKEQAVTPLFLNSSLDPEDICKSHLGLRYFWKES